MIGQPSSDRRGFLRFALLLSGGALLAGCGGGGGSDSASAPAVTTPTDTGPAAPSTSHPLNLSLQLAYLGAQFYGIAANGSGLAPALTGGVGQPGSANGARKLAFADPVVAMRAAELALDKQTHVTSLRGEIGAAAAAQPTLDLSASANGAFATAARTAGLASAGFDPYADDRSFLFGAFLIEDAVAAAYRSYFAQGGTSAVATANLADAIYHAGLVRALLDDRAAGDATLTGALAGAGAMFARFDGTDVGDQTLAAATGASSNLVDAAGRPIPFTRADAQVLKALYLSSSSVGGFLPNGANGVA